MLTKGDDFPLHQTSEPIAYAGSHRNFYDRYFFNGYAPDGSHFFALAFGVYPNINVADAHFSYIRDGIQHCLHASRELNMERFDLSVGPISIEVVEPLKRLIIRVDGKGIKAEISFTGRVFPIEEPRFVHRIGPRTMMDYTRMTQNGSYSGWIEVDGRRVDLPTGMQGTRDRSWGIRPIGAADSQPHGHNAVQSFFWQWTPINLPTRSIFFHMNANIDGSPWNSRAVIANDHAAPESFYETSKAHMETELEAGTRWPKKGVLTIETLDQKPFVLKLEPIIRFQMCGIGYVNPKWGHGLYHGKLVVEREDINLAAVNPMAKTMENFHVQIVSKVITNSGEVGMGTLEQLIVGPYAPFGLKDYFDHA